MDASESAETRRVLTRLKSDTGQAFERLFDLPLDVTPDKLQLLTNHLLENVSCQKTPSLKVVSIFWDQSKTTCCFAGGAGAVFIFRQREGDHIQFGQSFGEG